MATNKKIKQWLNYLYIPIIAPVIVAVILSFIKINKLEDKIQIQNTVMQSNKIEIETLNTVIQSSKIEIETLNKTVEKQNILINEYKQEIVVIENQIKSYIKTNHGPITVN